MAYGFYLSTGKRAVDSVCAAIGLLFLVPLLLVLAMVVKLSSRGPVFYWQQRVGRHGKVFRIVKFRSMIQDADKCGLAITPAGDSRITPVGHILRRLKLDELPQLWNVLRGDMSLVGPRPEVPRYVDSYTALQRSVLSVRPGITDLASILYRQEERLLGAQPDPERYYREVVLPDKLRLNVDYLNRVSFFYDALLVLRTARAIFSSTSIPGIQ